MRKRKRLGRVSEQEQEPGHDAIPSQGGGGSELTGDLLA